MQRLGGKISEKAWNTIIEHATSCQLDKNELYEYKGADGTLVVLNCIYQVDGVIFGGEPYVPYGMLNLSQKVCDPDPMLLLRDILSNRFSTDKFIISHSVFRHKINISRCWFQHSI